MLAIPLQEQEPAGLFKVMFLVRVSSVVILACQSMVLAGCLNITPGLSPPAKFEEGAPFGAIAFSKGSENWRIESDHPNRRIARNKALSGCKASDCTILLVFSRGECASMSLDSGKVSTSPFVAISTGNEPADQLARQMCKAGGGRDCKATPPICN